MGDKIINGSIIKKQISSKEEDRCIFISISSDNTEAYITIEYEVGKPERIYTAGEIREVLNKAGIVNGIIDENLISASRTKDVHEFQIAKGIKAINDVDDVIDIKFPQKSRDVNAGVDSNGRIDYRNLGAITSVKNGDVMAIKIVGTEGSDGVDIFGNEVPRKKKKKLVLKAGEGCTLLGDNTVIANLEGEPYVKNNVFYVYDVHSLNKDVSLETGDVVFVGDVKISGSVKEGMKVEAGNIVSIQGSVEGAKIIAKGDVSIGGNSIMSTITAGGKDMKIGKYISILQEARDMLGIMVETIDKLRQVNPKMSMLADGDIIKGLLETKFNELPKRCWGILRESFEQSDGEVDPLAAIIRGKLIGMAPLSIKHHSELDDIISMMEERIEQLETTLTLPVNINLNYCQDCTVESSGNVIINGPGEYVSNISADKGIYFTKDGSVARGGVLRANTEIVCKTVGSQGGVKTKLMASKKGCIKIDLAYPNTVISIGGRESVIDTPSTNVHAYINKDKELVVDKLKKL